MPAQVNDGAEDGDYTLGVYTGEGVSLGGGDGSLNGLKGRIQIPGARHTDDQLGSLAEKAGKLGETTRFSAAEAADAMGELALAGWNADQMLSGIDGVLNLAAASGMELADAASAISMNLAAFNLEAEEAGHLSDVLATAQAATTTEAAEMVEAWGNAATSFTQAGQSAETTTALLEGMASVGDRGASAGTALTSVMSQMRQKMKDGAIAIGDVQVAVMDANGNYRDMIDIIADVESAVDGLGTAERDAALGATFNRNSMNALKEILAAGSDKLRAYREDLLNCDGAAADMAATMQDNLAGQLTELKSETEALGRAWGNLLLPKAKSLVVGLKDMAGKLATTDDRVKNAAINFGLMAAAAGPVISFLGKLSSGLGSVITVAGSLVSSLSGGAGLIGALTAALGPGGAIVAAIAGTAALAGGMAWLVSKIDEATDPLKQLQQSMDNASQAEERLGKADGTIALTRRYQELRAELESGTLSEEEAAEKSQELDSIRQQLCDNTGGLIPVEGEYGDALDGTVEKVQTVAEAERDRASQEVYAQLRAGADDYQAALSDQRAMQEELTAAQEAYQAAVEATYLEGEAAAEEFGAALEDVQKKVAGWKDSFKDSPEGVEALNRELETLSQKASAIAGTEIKFEGLAEAESWFEDLNISTDEMADNTTELQGRVEELSGAMEESTAVTDAYRDKVIAWIKAGGDMEKGAALLGKSEEALQHEIRNNESAMLAQVAAENKLGDASGEAGEELEELSEEEQQAAAEAEEAQKKFDELVEGLRGMPGIVSATGWSLQDLSNLLYGAGISAEQFASGVSSCRDKVVNSFKAMKDESGITAQSMVDNLQANLQATQTWSSNLAYLWNSTTDNTVRAFINYLAQQGPGEYAGAIAEFASGGQAQLEEAAYAWQAMGDLSAQNYAAGIWMDQYLAAEAAGGLGDAAAASLEAPDGAEEAGAEAPSQYASGIENGSEAVSGAAEAMVQQALSGATGVTGWDALGTTDAGLVASGITSGAYRVRSAATAMMTAARSAAAGVTGWSNIGYAIASGVASGVSSGSSMVSSAVRSMISSALAAGRSEAQINSPSKLFRDVIGSGIAEGVAAGIEGGDRMVRSAMGYLTNQALAAGNVHKTYNYSTSVPAINLTVNAAPGQDAQTVGRQVVRQLVRELQQKGAVYAKAAMV